MDRKFPALVTLLATLILPGALLGQGTVTIFGSVTDPTGAALPGAIVTVKNQSTARTRQTVSGSDGSYTIPDLAPGTYQLSAQANGFKIYIQDDIQVQVDENRRVPIPMTLGALSEQVSVKGDIAQVETRTGTLKEVIDSARIEGLPLNGRNAVQLQYLVAGAGGIAAPGQGQNESVSINGSRPNTNNYSLDGADNHDPFFNTPGVFPNPDALDEFSMQTSAYSADRGRNAGALMNAVTKSGTNRIHGALFEFLRNEKLNARNFFAKAAPPFKRNQFGGTTGGPIRKDKSFFFVSYQGTRERSSPGSQTPIVLTEAQRNGDFSALLKPLKNPAGGTFPGNMIPRNLLSAPAQGFLKAFVPLPNAPGGLYSFASQQTVDDDQTVSKIDHNVSQSHLISGRLLWSRNNTNQVVNNTTLPGFLALIQYRNWNAAINDTYTFSPHLLNQFTFGFTDITRQQLPILPEGGKSWTDFGAGITRAAPGPVGHDTQLDGYFSAQSRYLLNQFRKQFQFTDGLNWTLGSHSLKFGGDIRQSILNMDQTFQTDPLVRFRATFTGDPGADFILGRPTTISQQSPNSNRPRTIEADAYVQDDWKVNQRLTLNLGLRWDPYFPFHDLDRRLSQVRPGVQSIAYPTAPSGYVFPGDPGVSETTLRAETRNFAPRLGFAWDLFGDGRTILRGGYGIFYSEIRQQANNQLSTNQPFAVKLVINNPSGGLANPYADTGNPFPYLTPVTPQEKQKINFFLPLTVTEWDPNFRNAQAQQWNLSVQRQIASDWIITAAYVGSRGTHLFLTNESNPAIYGRAGRTADARRLLAPNFSSILVQTSVGNSFYNALQATANKRLAHGVTLLLNYTWSKAIDYGSEDGSGPANPFNIRGDKAVSDYDIPHRLSSSFIWRLPQVASHGALLRSVAGGWEVNGIVTVQRGQPFSVVSGVDNSQSAVNKDRADQVGDWRLPGDRSKNDIIGRYLNTGAFNVNGLGTFGNSGRNILRAPGTSNADFGLIKTFSLTEGLSLRFRAEAFNAFNHAKLGAPNANASSASFGRITTAGSPRVLQMALKLVF